MGDESSATEENERRLALYRCLAKCSKEFTEAGNVVLDFHYNKKTMSQEEALSRLDALDKHRTYCQRRCIHPAGRHFTDEQKEKFEKNEGFSIATGVMGIVAITAAGLFGVALPILAPVALITGGIVGFGIANHLLAADPIDPNFSELPTPSFPKFPDIQPVPNTGLTASVAGAANAVMANQAKAIGLLNALITALNRSDGAREAGDKPAERRQLKAARDFARELAKVIRDSASFRRVLANKWRGPGLDFSISKQDALQARDEIIISGFPSPFLDALKRTRINRQDRDRALDRLTVELAKLQIGRTGFRKLVTDLLRDPKLRAAEVGVALSLEQFSQLG
jgi:hypothetical protein